MSDAFKKLAEEFRDATALSKWNLATLKLMIFPDEPRRRYDHDYSDLVTTADGYGEIPNLRKEGLLFGGFSPECIVGVPENADWVQLQFYDAMRTERTTVEVFAGLAGRAGARLPGIEKEWERIGGGQRLAVRWCLELFRVFGRSEWWDNISTLNGNAFELSAELCDRLAGTDPKPVCVIPEKRITTRKKPRQNVNARMAETILSNPDAMGWTSHKWARELKCAASSVVATETWKQLEILRSRQKAEKRTDRRQRRDKSV